MKKLLILLLLLAPSLAWGQVVIPGTGGATPAVVAGNRTTVIPALCTGTDKVTGIATGGIVVCNTDVTGTTSPLTTKGDLWGFSTADGRVAVGTNDQCLVADSTAAFGIKWGSCAAGGTGITSLGGETGSTQTFSKVDDTNVTLTIASATDDHKFTLGWTGTLADSRLASNYSGVGSCTNQFVRATVDDAAPTCASIADADLPSTNALDTELHPQVHVLVSADHTASGLTIGYVVRATSTTAFAWQQLGFSDLGGSATAGQVPNLESLNGTLDIASGGTGQTTANPAFNALSPVTTEGDLIYRNATVNARLARGANGECLTASASTILWGSCGGAGDGVGYDEVLEEASGLTKRAQINFIGVDVTAVDNGGATRTDVTIIPVAEAYDATGWNADTGAASKDNVRDKIESLDFSDLAGTVAAGQYAAASIDGDDIASGLAGTGLTLTAASPDTLDCDAASTTAVGCPEMAIASEVDTGTSTILAVTPDALAGSEFGQVEVQMVAFDFTTAVATGDGKFYFHIATGSKLIGMNLIDAIAAVITVSSSGLPTVDIARCAPVATGNPCSGTVADVLSTNLTIDANEDSSDTATTAAVIAGASDDVIVDQTWRIDVDVAGTGTQGLIVTLIFQLP